MYIKNLRRKVKRGGGARENLKTFVANSKNLFWKKDFWLKKLDPDRKGFHEFIRPHPTRYQWWFMHPVTPNVRQ